MSCEVPYISYMALYVISLHFINCNSRSSVHWKLNLEEDTIVEVNADDKTCSLLGLTPNSYKVEDDLVFNILTSTIIENGKWIKEYSTEQDPAQIPINKSNKKEISDPVEEVKDYLDCGETVNYTVYDHMSGIINRYLHPHFSEPDIAVLFKKNGNKKEIDINQLEKKLRKLKKEKPNSTDTFNQIGNFWRIKGDTVKSIDCFRKTLSISPNDPDALLSLARILFNLQYLEDAIFLARRSVEVHPPQQSAWLHHFKLGEILKAYGHYHEASLQFKQTLELNPSFKQASIYLKEIESLPDTTVHIYTFFIIVILVLTVFLGILSTVEAHAEDFVDGLKTKRHFNRAMAMRSIKLGMNPRNLRCRKYHS